MPWKVFKTTDGGETKWCVHKLMADDSKGERVKCFDSEAAANNQLKALYANVKETRGMFQDVLVVRELRADFPTDIPFFADVDIAQLTRGDDDPVYLTIPIGQANVVSGNKRFYDEAWLQELERQVTAKRPIGIMGHLKDEDLATEYPPEAIFWVGVRRIGELLWGKGYIPAGAARDRIRRYKAANKAIATSIYAMADSVWDKARGALHMLAETLDLRQIDIGPADRVGIPSLARVPLLTAEMQVANNEQEQEVMAKNEVIQELLNTKVTPQRGWQGSANGSSASGQVSELDAIRTTLGVDEKADLPKIIAEMAQTQAAQAKAAVKAHIAKMATPDPKRKPEEDVSIAQETVRKLVIEMVEARQPATVQEAETAYQAVLASPNVTELLKARVIETMGPKQTTAVAGKQGAAKYFNIPEEAKG